VVFSFGDFGFNVDVYWDSVGFEVFFYMSVFSLLKVPSLNPPVASAAIMKASRVADLSSIVVISSGLGARSL